MRKKILIMTLLIAMLIVAGIAAAQGGNQPGGWIGIALDLRDGQVIVTEVRDGSPGAEAGVQVDDVIVNIDGEPVDSITMLRRTLRDYEVGDTVTLEILRGGETLELDIELAAPPAADVPMPFLPNGSMVIPSEGQGLSVALFGVITEDSEDGWIVQQVLPFADEDFQEGDVITAIDGQAVADLNDLDLVDFLRGEHETLEVTVLRDGEEMTLEISRERGNVFVGPGDFGMVFPTENRVLLGVQFQPLDEAAAEELGIETTEGAYIIEVLADSPAEDAGLQAEDIITAVDGTTVNADNPLDKIITGYEPGATLTLTVLRDGEAQEMEVTLAQETMFFGRDGEVLPFPEDFEFHFNAPFAPRDLNRLLDELGVTLPENGNVAIECKDDTGETVFSLDVNTDADGNSTTSFSVPGGGFEGFGNLDLDALNCTVDTQATPDATPEPSGSGA